MIGIDIKRFISKRAFAIFFSVLVVCSFVLFLGIDKYFSFKGGKAAFQKTEEVKVNSYSRTSQYGGYGIKLMLIPPSASALSGSFEDINSNVNSAHVLDISKPVKGRSYFERSNAYTSYTGLTLLLWSIFAVLWGHETHKKDYLRLLYNSHKRILPVLMTRAILMTLLFLLFNGLVFLWALIMGVNLFNGPVFILLFALLLVLIFHYSIGLIIGTIRDDFFRYAALTAVIFCGFFLVPPIAEKITNIRASKIESRHSYEFKNFQLYMELEKRLTKRFGTFEDNSNKLAPEELVNAVEIAMNEEFWEFRSRETERKKELEERLKESGVLSAFFPVTFYLETSKEISGQGGRSFIDFYSFSQEKKRAFIHFYVKNRFLSRAKPGMIESFVTGDENIFYSRPRLPYGFTLGLIMTLLYTLGLWWWSLRRINRRLKPGKIVMPELGVEEGESYFMLCRGDTRGIIDFYRQQETAAVICSADRETYIFVDCLRGETREFEQAFDALFNSLRENNKTVIYIGSQLYEVRGSLFDESNIQERKAIPVDFEEITLR
jgi:hypothetical protein